MKQNTERLNEVADAVDQMRLKAIDTDKPTEFTAVAQAGRNRI